MKGGWKGGGVLKFDTCLRILLFLNNRSVVHFCGWWGVGVKKLVIFGGSNKWMTPKNRKTSYHVFCFEIYCSS